MAYFSKGSTRHKLCILFFLRELGSHISKDECFRVFAQQGWLDYFDFQSALNELEEDAYAAAVPCAVGHGYVITEQGKDALDMFEEELPFSMRENIRAYIRLNRDMLKDNAEVLAYKSAMPSGGYCVFMRLMDKNSGLLDISLRLDNPEISQSVVEQWPKVAGRVYSELINMLCSQSTPKVEPDAGGKV